MPSTFTSTPIPPTSPLSNRKQIHAINHHDISYDTLTPTTSFNPHPSTMHLHYFFLLLTLLTLLLPLTTPFPLNSTSLFTTTTTTRSLSLHAPPSCPRYRKRHGGHLRYRLSRLRTACRPQPQPRGKERDVLDDARIWVGTSPDGQRRALPAAGRALEEGAAAAPDL